MKQQPILMDELTDIERASLASLVLQPGWKVVEKIHTEACKRATEAVIRLDPVEEERYEHKLAALQSKARERNEFSGLILKSVQYHIDAVAEAQREESEKAPQNPILGQKENQ